MKKLFFAISLYFISTISFCNSQVFPAILRQWAGYAGNTDSTFKTPVITKESYTYVAATVVDSLTGANIDLIKYDTEGKIVWTYSWTGSGYGRDQASDIVYGNDSLIYVCGTTHTVANDFDFLVFCVTSQGNLKWSRTYNGTASQYDVATSMDVRDTIVFVTGVAYNTGSFLDYHTICYDWNGNLIWQNDFDYNSLMDIPFQLTTSAEGVFVTGGSQNSLQDWDYQTVKYEFDGTLLGQDRVSGSAAGFDRAQAVTSDDSGYIYITGGTMGNDFDINTAKFGKYGNLIWTNKLDYGGNDIAYDVVTDTLGNVYICGSSDSVGVGMDFFVARLDPATGNEIWSRHIDGYFTNDSARAMCIDAFNNVVVTGQVFEKYANAYDFYTVAFDSLGTKVWQDQFDGPDHLNDNATNIASDANGNIFVTGQVTANSEIQTVTIKYRTDYFIQPPTVDTPSAAYLFYPNEGQLIDDNNNDIQDSVHYYTLHHNPQLYFGYGVMNMVFNHIDEDTTTADTLQRVDVSFLNSSNPTQAFPVKVDEDSYLNYYLAQCPNGITNIHGVKNLVYSDVWDDIDVIYSSNNAGLKLAFICAPGSTPSEIGLLFNGQDSIYIDQNWYLKVQTAIGSYGFPKPRVYQIDSYGNRIQLSWQLSWNRSSSNEATFSGFGTYDITKYLIIEFANAVLTNTSMPDNADWGTYLGVDNNDDCIIDNTLDPSKRYYVCGFSKSNNFPGSSIGLVAQHNLSGITDAFVTGFKTDLSLAWSTYYGGDAVPSSYWYNEDVALGIVSDKDGQIYFVGLTNSTNFPMPSTVPSTGYFQDYLGGEVDGFIVELNTNGSRAWATYYGGITKENIHAIIAPLDQDYLAVCGSVSHHTEDPGIVFPLPTTFVVGNNGCSAPDPSATPTSFNSGFALCNPGSAYFDNSDNGGTSDGFIAKFDLATHDLEYSSLFGGPGEDIVQDLEFDASSNDIVFIGQTSSTTSSATCSVPASSEFPLCDNTTGYFQTANSGSSLIPIGFIGEINSSNALVWSSFFGGCQDVRPTHLAFNSQGDLYVSGFAETSSNNLPAIPCQENSNCSFPLCNPGSGAYYQDDFDHINNSSIDYNKDLFITRFGTDRLLKWSTFYGGTGDEYQNFFYFTDSNSDITIDSQDRVFLLTTSRNITSSVTGNVTMTSPISGVYQDLDNSVSNRDALLAVFGGNNHLYWSTYIGEEGTEMGTATIADGDDFLYVAGAAQISAGQSSLITGDDIGTAYVQPTAPTNNFDGFIWRFDLTSFVIGIDELSELSNFVVYPNPASNKLNLNFQNTAIGKEIQLQIFDMLGKCLYDKKLNINQNSFDFQIDISKFSNAVYYICLSNDRNILKKKFIVHK